MTISRIIGCISAKGGVGKTTSSINLAAALNYFGKSVTLVDANLTTPNVGIYLGFPVPTSTLHDSIRGKKDVKDVIIEHKSGVKIVPGSISLKDAQKSDHAKLSSILRELDGHTDFMVVDSAPGISKEALSVLHAVHEVIIITNPEMPAVTDALKTVRLCKELRKDVIGVLVTKTNAKNVDMSIKSIEDILEIPVIGVIPEDRAVKYALASKEAVVHSHPRSAAAVQYKRLAADLLNLKYSERIEMAENTIFDDILIWLGFKD